MLERAGTVDSQRRVSLSTPSTAIPSGTRKPAAWQASSTSRARPSIGAKTAVGRGNAFRNFTILTRSSGQLRRSRAEILS